MIVTRGYGEKQMIVARGFGSLPSVIVEAICVFKRTFVQRIFKRI